MAAPKDFVTGFNHNVRHKGQGYHVQTEDSGTQIAHVITHLFQGGNILASKKTSYAELRGSPDLKAQVRLLMEEQHRQMLRQLVNGAYDQPEQTSESESEGPAAQALPAPPAEEQPAPAAATSKRAAPIEVVRFPPPGLEQEDEDFDASIDIETSIGFLPSVEVSGGPRAASETGALEAAVAASDPAAPAAEEAGAGQAAPAAGAPLWPTATEAALINRSDPPTQAVSAPAPSPRGGERQAPMQASQQRVDRTPGPSPWAPDPQPDTIFGDEDGAAEKSLDQVILRYLAGERDE